MELARAEQPSAVVVDSIQTATIDELDGAAGSVGQVRESTLRLMELAKGDGIAVVLVGHVTKDGSIAGPKTLEHLVDAVINLEGERYAALRLLRATKNRFGSTDEVGVFEMAETGLLEVADPARAFLADHGGAAPGSVVAPTLEGSRPLLVEVQALVSPSAYGTPSRKASGRRSEPAEPAHRGPRPAGRRGPRQSRRLRQPGRRPVRRRTGARPAARPRPRLVTRDRPIAPGTVAIGEVGLLGELRAVVGLERRLREAARLGFGRAIVPASQRGDADRPDRRASRSSASRPCAMRSRPRCPTGRSLVARPSPRC